MNRTTRAALALAALGLALGGCTGSADDDKAEKKATPQETWAKSLCTALAPTTEAINPPETSDDDVAKSKKEIEVFLKTLRNRLKSQADVLKNAGAPPDVDPTAYDQAQASLNEAATTLGGVMKQLQEADPADAAEMQTTLMQLSESLAGAATYQGPLAQLSESDPNLKKAFENDDQCVAIMS